MTIADAISLVDNLKPNLYNAEIKMRWLSKLDGQIFEETILTHVREEEAPAFTPYTDMTQELIVPFPYSDDVYINYLQAMIDRENGEMTRYNQSISLYSAAYGNYQAWYNRTHMPKSHKRFRF